jgi:hypothetical protein
MKPWLKKLLLCWWFHWKCKGTIDHDDISVFWKCSDCGRIYRGAPW